MDKAGACQPCRIISCVCLPQMLCSSLLFTLSTKDITKIYPAILKHHQVTLTRCRYWQQKWGWWCQRMAVGWRCVGKEGITLRACWPHCVYLNFRADFKSLLNNLVRAHRIVSLLQGTQAWDLHLQKDTCADEIKRHFLWGHFPFYSSLYILKFNRCFCPTVFLNFTLQRSQMIN